MGTSKLRPTVKTFDQMYVGLVAPQQTAVPLGFMVPDGTDAGAIKRKQTVDHWASTGYYGRKKLTAQTHKNEPIEGFKFVDHIRYPSRNGIDKWRIYDPRGFELEITSRNVLHLIFNGAVMQGMIQGKCIWVRERAQNLLIMTNSEEYKEAITYTKKVAQTKKLRNGD
jgi:hypothetical protein